MITETNTKNLIDWEKLKKHVETYIGSKEHQEEIIKEIKKNLK